MRENNCSVDCSARGESAFSLSMCDKRDRADSAIRASNFKKRLGGVNDVN